MLGVLDGAGAPADPDPVNRMTSKVQAVVALYAGLDLARIKTARGVEALTLFLGPLHNKRYAEASPITYVTSDDAPFLLFHGDMDDTVPFEQSQVMQAALKKAGVRVEFVPVPGGRHGRNFGFEPDDKRLPDYIGKGVDWFDTHLHAR